MDSIGIDIVEISRIKKAISRFGDRFLNRIFTPNELKLYRDKPQSLAARFAAKEAVAKSLKAKNLSWQDAEILSADGGKPVIHLHGKAERRARLLGLGNFSVSLSHSRSHAVAFVIARKVRSRPRRKRT